jgi:hypothetical protein
MLPLAEIKPGLRGTGHTVFNGSSIETFDVEVLGVLENIGPKQSVILAKLSGGPLTSTGVMQGMSGSPVYIGGKLAGAVAYSFPFSKEPIAGIRPIQEMLVSQPAPPKPARVALAKPDGRLLPEMDRGAISAPGFGSGLMEIATPISFGGFTAHTLEHFAPQLRSLGFEPRQGTSSGSSSSRNVLGDTSQVRPGSMISVQLLSGDVSAGADGTVTYVDGKRIYAFGHRFLSAGTTELPFARAEVLALLPSVSSSFKISTAREWMGTITDDRSTAVAGELGKRASMIPVKLAVLHPERSGRTEYSVEMVKASRWSKIVSSRRSCSRWQCTRQLMLPNVGLATPAFRCAAKSSSRGQRRPFGWIISGPATSRYPPWSRFLRRRRWPTYCNPISRTRASKVSGWK